ncbi:MAG: flavin reductase family protein [Acidobacteria bacterium]|nr:flavin reductase family protein [Acidobacteriota bacterium]
MHYDAIANAHGLAHDPFKALVGPRPIGWITSVSADGVCNLAPYSFFNAVSDRPHYVMFSSSGKKDSLRNIHETGEFTCSMATWDTRFAMNVSSAPVAPDVDEYQVAGLTAVASRFVKPPRVREAPAALECTHWKTIELPDVEAGSDQGHFVVFGRVVGIYIDDAYVHDGRVDTGAMRPIARLGYMQYAAVTPETVFDIDRPSIARNGSVVRS